MFKSVNNQQEASQKARKHILFIIRTQITRVIFEDVGRSAENATMGEDLHFDCLRFDFWEGRKPWALISKIGSRMKDFAKRSHIEIG